MKIRNPIDEFMASDRLRREAFGLSATAASERLIRDAMGLNMQDRLFREALGLSTRGAIGSALATNPAQKQIADSIQQIMTGARVKSLADQISGGWGAIEQAKAMRGVLASQNSPIESIIAAASGINTPRMRGVLEQAQTAQDHWRKTALGIGTFDRAYRESLSPISEVAKAIQRQQDEIAGLFSRLHIDQFQSIRTATEMAWRMSAFYDEAEWEELEEASPNALVALLVTLFNGFVGNSKEQMKGFGILQILQFLSVCSAIITIFGAADYTDSDRQVAADTLQHVKGIERQLGDALAVKLGEVEYLESLPRAEVKRKARVRQEPSRDASILTNIDGGTEIAIVEKKDRWARIVFADPLTMKLREGWIWRGSIEPLNADDG